MKKGPSFFPTPHPLFVVAVVVVVVVVIDCYKIIIPGV